MLNKIRESAEFLRNKKMDKPEIGIILGTGLGKMVHEIALHQQLDYGDIPHFPVSTVEFHKGRLIYGQLEGKMVLAMQGRFHYYEGYSMQEITFPVRVMKELGVKYLLISNAAGAMNLAYKKGSLMLIDDHINLLSDGPLRGSNDDTLGPRFPDMSQPYSKKINDLMEQVAVQHGILLHKGVYVAVAGPNLETRAEYRFLRGIGADVVGMSTVPEAIVANHSGLPCAAVSVLTDECDPENLKPVDIKDIIETASVAENDLIKLFKGVIREL
ncbi:MAG: purine-nucleoside phosphorylase [Bacteroidales bacterium]|nr:purine-nucleoside phosphorylase [Bacteroidales bacterium]MCF8404579.1 purine-nucleoside phosphorylase [Bacteroidales bacterium]